METWELVGKDREVLLAIARSRAARAAYSSLREMMSDLDPSSLGDIQNDMEEFRKEEQRSLEALGARLPETMLGLHGLLSLARDFLQNSSAQHEHELGLLGRVLTLSDGFVRNQLRQQMGQPPLGGESV